MSKLSIQVDFQYIKIGISTPSSNINYPFIKLGNLNLYCLKIEHSKFKSFFEQEIKQIQTQLLQEDLPLTQYVGISGFGANEQEEYEEMNKIVQSTLKLILIKQKAINSSLKAIDNMIGNNQQKFFCFEKVLELKELQNLKQGFVFQKNSLQCPSYPFLYVNVNRSVSFYKVRSGTNFIKLNGSLITDTTLEHLFSLLGLNGELNEHINRAFEIGDNTKSDMTVEDIYGSAYEKLQLPKDIIASSLGKLQTLNPKQVGIYDIVKSIWYSFVINLGQLTALNAKIEDLNQVVVGSNKITTYPFLGSLQSTIDFFGKQSLKVYFIEDSEYLTCM